METGATPTLILGSLTLSRTSLREVTDGVEGGLCLMQLCRTQSHR